MCESTTMNNGRMDNARMNNSQKLSKSLRPVVLAPMAGGPSTPRLAAAVAAAGGLPFLAAGYLSPEKLQADITELESYLERASAELFGVNLFAPDPRGQGCDAAVYSRYRARVLEFSGASPELLPVEPIWSDDAFDEKLEIVCASAASFVSFTFAHPAAAVVERVHAAGKLVIFYATSKPGIDAIVASDADVIGIQGPNAGGHRATVFGVDDDSNESVLELVEYARGISRKPIIAGGGVSGAADVRNLLRAGATGVQVGTLFLNAQEAGTKQTHRDALEEFRGRDTVITRAFTGRPARTIENRFSAALSDSAPAFYPQLHFLTAGLRKKANERGDGENLNLWAGTWFAHAKAEPAADIVGRLLAARD